MKYSKKTVIIGILLVVIIAMGAYFFTQITMLNKYHRMIDKIVISDVDLTTVPDGVYLGSSEAILVAAKVAVTVVNHRMTKIDLVRHKNGRGKPAEVIPDRVLAAQSLKVDAVSGATSSSKVILKAVERALKSAGKN